MTRKRAQSRGESFREAVSGTYELTGTESELLTEACRTLDDLDRLDEAIRRDGAMVVGAAGQPVVNPALTEARGQRAILHRLMAALALPDVDGEAVPTAQTIRAKTAAAARWAGHTKDAG